MTKWLNKYFGWIITAIGAVVGFILLTDRSADRNKQSAADAKAAADEHEDMANHHLAESNKLMDEAMDAHDKAVELAEDITEPNDDEDLPPGFTRKHIRSK